MDARNVNVFNLTTNGCGVQGREGKGVREAEKGRGLGEMALPTATSSSALRTLYVLSMATR